MATERRCQICGSKRTADDKSPELCYYLCYWILEGWLGYNAKNKVVAVRDQRALRFVPTSKTDPASKISYPKMLDMARALGWTGDKEARTFPPLAAKAKGAGQ